MNKAIDAELYAVFQMFSHYDEDANKTVVNKWDLPKQNDICKLIGIKSTKTYRTHLQALMDLGYIIKDDEKDKYTLPNIENFYLLLPLSTLQYMSDVFKDVVVKIYLYLGMKWKTSDNKEFTFEELAAHTGLKLKGHERAYAQIRNALYALQCCGFIEVSEEYFVEVNKSRRKLLMWTDEINR